MANGRYSLPVFTTLGDAWSKVYGAKATFWATIGIFILSFITGMAITVGLSMLTPILGIIAYIVVIFYSVPLILGQYYLGYLRAKDMPINFKMMFRGIQDPMLTLKIIGTMLLVGIILAPAYIVIVLVSLGVANGGAMDSTIMHLLVSLIYLVCTIVLVYLVARVYLAMLFVIDRQVNPITAITLSFKATRSNVLSLIFIYFLLSVIVILSELPLFIGLIWTLPYSFITIGTVYKQLSTNNMD